MEYLLSRWLRFPCCIEVARSHKHFYSFVHIFLQQRRNNKLLIENIKNFNWFHECVLYCYCWYHQDGILVQRNKNKIFLLARPRHKQEDTQSTAARWIFHNNFKRPNFRKVKNGERHKNGIILSKFKKWKLFQKSLCAQIEKLRQRICK